MRNGPGKILIVDDDPNILLALTQVLERPGMECITFVRGEEAVVWAQEQSPDLAFIDLAMPGMGGQQLLRALREHDGSIPVVMITAFGDMESAVQATQGGAYEFLTKPLDLQRLRLVASRALEYRALSLRLKRIEDGAGAEPLRSQIIGRHPKMIELFRSVGAASMPGNRSTVLITGETGTGKELIARSIHDSSPARQQPFVVVNCAGMVESLVENELFGHEKGAYTGASHRTSGKVETAGAGSVFLDEVGDLPLAVQHKLLRILETGEYERIGGTTTLTTNARFIAATNRDLEAAARGGTFRWDLFYRLNVISICIPPLRQRCEDIPLLADHFLRKHVVPGEAALLLSPDALALLMEHDYAGNVRELEHMLERGITLAPGSVITPEHLPAVTTAPARPAGGDSADSGTSSLEAARKRAMNAFERGFLTDVLERTEGNVTGAAEQAGVRRQYLQRLLKKHGIDASQFRSR